MSKLLQLLKSKNTVLADGAVGTLIYDQGVFINRCFEEINITNPDIISNIHKKYKNAGSDFISTNTFAANHFSLKSHGLEDKIKDIILSGVNIANTIAGHEILVAGSIGPLGISTLEPYGSIQKRDAEKAFTTQAKLLEEGKVDFFILETFSYIDELLIAIETISNISSLPIIAQVNLAKDDRTITGESISRLTKKLNKTTSIAIGINCSNGPKQVLEASSLMKNYTDKYIIAQANIGRPETIDTRQIYLNNPEYFGNYTQHFIRAGIKIIGGCCGSTPKHIEQMKIAIKAISQNPTSPTQIHHKTIAKLKTIPKIEQKTKSQLARKILNKEFITTVEITPPKGCNPKSVIEKTIYLKEQGVDAINIPDGPRASSRMSAMLLAILIEQEAKIESIMHYTCRDRNILGMQSDLLGAYASGLNNILIVTGDPPKMGDYPDATPVFDLDSVGLTQVVNNLNHGIDIGSSSMQNHTGYFIGVGVNPTAYDINYELDKLQKKIDAGAKFAITQPAFDTKVFLDFLDKLEDMKINIPIIAGIWPLVSYRNAVFMANEVPGVSISEDIMDRMKQASDISKERAIEEGISISHETISKIKDKINGVQVSAPFGKVDYALSVMKDILLAKKNKK